MKNLSYFYKDISKALLKKGISDEILVDKVVIHASVYKEIFGHTYKQCDNKPWKRGIVKIKRPWERQVIYRLFLGCPSINGFKKSNIYFPKHSKYMLPKVVLPDKSICNEYLIDKGNRFLFYWQHPSHTIRGPFKVSFFLGIISIILGIFSIIK